MIEISRNILQALDVVKPRRSAGVSQGKSSTGGDRPGAAVSPMRTV